MAVHISDGGELDRMASVVTFQFGAVSDIKAGVGVFVTAVSDSGKTAARLLIIGTDGTVPPI